MSYLFIMNDPPYGSERATGIETVRPKQSAKGAEQ